MPNERPQTPSRSPLSNSAALLAWLALPLAAFCLVLAIKVALRDGPESAAEAPALEAEREAVPAPAEARDVGPGASAGKPAQPNQPAPAAETAAPAATEGERPAPASGPPADAKPSASPAVASVPQPIASPPPPWQAALDRAGEPPPYAQQAFLPFEEAFTAAARADLTPWFEAAGGAGFRVGKLNTRYGQSGTIEGLGKLRCPWPVDGVLRLSLDNCDRLKLHFFHGDSGVTLVYYEDLGYRWAAYATSREPEKPLPSAWAITATDDDRCRRTEIRLGGTVELRHRAGELILSRGDVVLLTAPLAGPPTGVFFEGRATIHGIALDRTSDAPAAEPPRQVTQTIDRPAKLRWTSSVPQTAAAELLAAGAVRLAGHNLGQRAECFAPLPAGGPCEVILELADVSPGAGVYLGRADGKPAHVLRFVQGRRRGELGLCMLDSDSQWRVNLDAPADKPAPVVRPHCWIRLLAGCGNLRWWLSTDGVHWAQTEPARDNVAPGTETIGLSLVANCPAPQLTLRRIALRPLTGLTALAREELLDRAAGPTDATSLADWLAAVLPKKPPEIGDADWLRACAIRSLAAGPNRMVAYRLLESLLDDAADRRLPAEQQLAALNDAMLMALDLRDRQAMRVGLWNRYAQLGIRAADDAGQPAWSAVRAAYHAAPAVTWMHLPPDLDRVIRHELVTLAAAQQPAAALGCVERLRFFHQDRERPLVDWVESLARRGGPPRAATESASRPKESWRELLVEPLSKDAYAVLTELQAAIAGQTWDDAARVVTSLKPDAAPGIAPALDDKALLTTAATAVQMALEDHPPLQQAVRAKFAALGSLRIGQAITAGDAAALELATVQFSGTPAAAQAQRWLGDRALVEGQFERALVEYGRASRADPDAAGLNPRVRLAAAMLGRDAGEPATGPVELGQVSLSAAEFETLITQMQNRGATSGLLPTHAQASSAVPQPTGFEAHVRSRLDGPIGERPQEETGRKTGQLRVPWVDRQLATAVAGDTLYVANHFQVAAYSLTSGARLWQSQPPPGTMQRAQEWNSVPMRPVVLGERIFVRLLYSPAGPMLVCLERATGKLVWVAEHRTRELFASDPLLVQGELMCLGIVQHADQPLQLRHYTLDSQSGEIVRQRDVVQLRGAWTARSCCEVAAIEDGLVAALGGATVGLDSQGHLRWARSHVALPAEEDPRWPLQLFQAPVVEGDRVYIAQPGVRSVECLAGSTGRRHWSAILPEVVGIIGLAGDVLVVQTETDVRGLNKESGVSLWRYPATDLFSFHLVDRRHILLASRTQAPGEPDSWQVRLTWLDPASGQALAAAAMPSLSDSDPRLGPLAARDGRLFAFFGRGQFDATRDFVELVASGAAQPIDKPPTAWHALATAQAEP